MQSDITDELRTLLNKPVHNMSFGESAIIHIFMPCTSTVHYTNNEFGAKRYFSKLQSAIQQETALSTVSC